jgi:hypothetical protein
MTSIEKNMKFNVLDDSEIFNYSKDRKGLYCLVFVRNITSMPFWCFFHIVVKG